MKFKGVIFGASAAFALSLCGGEKLVASGDTLVFMGDSITDFGVQRCHGYVNLVVKGLAANGINPTWAGVGVQGHTSTDMLKRFDDDVIAKKPTVVTISAGVNDLLKGVSYDQFRKNMKDMVAKVKKAGATAVLLSPTASGYSENDSEALRQYAGAVKAIAAEEGLSYAPVYEMFRAWVDDPDAPALSFLNGNILHATCDACHMAPAGDRQLARATLQGLGLDADELSKAEAAWNADATLVPLGLRDKQDASHVVRLTDAEAAAVTAAGGLRQVLQRGIPSLAAAPTREQEASGATQTHTVNNATGTFSYREYDQLLIAARKLGENLDGAIRCAVLRGVRDTGSLVPSAPAVVMNGVHRGSTSATFDATISSVGATAGACDVLLRIGPDAESLGASRRIAVGESVALDYLLKDLTPDTAYAYELTFVNNATTPRSAVVSGSFSTLAEGALQPSGDDDTAVIQAAIDAAAKTHGTVTLAGGVFSLSGELTLADGVSLVGQGMRETTLQQRAVHRVMTIDGGARLEGVTVTGGKETANWAHGAGVKLLDGTISWCCIRDNRSTGNNIYGGGVYAVKGTIDHCVITGNRAGGSSSAGGGIGSYAYMLDVSVVIDTCLIYGNTVPNGNGGGVGFKMGSPQYDIRNTTIADNVSGSTGGGLFFENGMKKVTLVNSIVSGNTGNSAESNVSGPLASGSSGNLVDGIPSFADVDGHDYRLGAGSAAIGAGTWYAGIAADLDGVSRKNPPSAGCYEAKEDTPTVPHAHIWGGQVYQWTKTASGYDCTASAVCAANAAHRTTATVAATYAVTLEPTETEGGTGLYTATFAEPFTTQTKSVTLPKTGGTGVGDDPADAVPPSGDTTGAHDAQILQSLIEEASPNGTVTLGSGTFYLNAELMVASGVTLKGQGWEKTTLRQTAGGSRVVTVKGGAKLEGVTVTGGKMTSKWVHGGGVLVEDGTVSWCNVNNNSISGGNSYGAGVCLMKGVIDHSVVAFNTCEGSAIVAGIAVNEPTGEITIDTCLVRGNRAVLPYAASKCGGIGIQFVGQARVVTIRNTTIVGNVAGVSGKTSEGGAVWTDNDGWSKLRMFNCIIADNVTEGSATDVALSYEGGVDHCLFDKSGDKVGDGSAVGDPLFKDAANGDYALTSASPAKGAGTTYSGIGKDLAGCDFANPPSLGCYEFVGSTPPEEPPEEPGGDEDDGEGWIRESATTFGSTGAWTGDRAVVASGRISVSNATFTAAKAAPQEAVVTVTSTFDFGDADDEPFDTTKCAGIKVVSVGGVNRYAMLTAAGTVTNLAVVAKVGSPAIVSVTLDNAAHTVAYLVDGTELGTYSMSGKAKGVSTVRYAGETDVSELNGAYRTATDPGGNTPVKRTGVKFFID